MNSLRQMATVWLVLTAVLFIAVEWLIAKEDGRPNIVLIISDDQAWNDYSFMGHPHIETPNLDRLASQSALFKRGYVPTSLCRPSLATIITGLYAHQHGITGNDPANLELRPELLKKIDRLQTLPRWLSTKGYRSFQSGKWWEGSFQRGGFTHGMTHGWPADGGRHGDEGLTIGRKGLQPIFDFIESAEENPFFVWYAPFLPHTPHNPPERLLQKYQAKVEPVRLAKYYAMCEWFDETCGQLVQFLDEKQLADNTLVIYVTDNGWIQRTKQMKIPEGWTAGFAPRSKQSPFEGGIRTPIMLRWPGKIQPKEYEHLVSSIDLCPTILAAVGVTNESELPGKDLLPLVVEGKSFDRHTLFGEVFAHDIADLDDPSASLLYLWCINQNRKLIWRRNGKKGRYGHLHPQMDNELAMFDLTDDPHERIDLSGSREDVMARMKSEIEQWYPEGD